MSQINFIASSKKFILPDEIKEYNNRRVFEREEDFMRLNVSKVENDGWGKFVNVLFTLPYIYEIFGLGNGLFLLYLEKYMEVGDVIELLHIPDQHDFDYYKRRIVENPQPIVINVGSLTYQDQYGTYRLNPKKWVEELSHKNYINEFGITTIIKY